MNVSKTLVSTAAAMAIAGVVGFAFAQSNPENINVKPSNNLTQTQSDAALPCQPTPFNPHLPRDAKSRSDNTVNGTTADCATPSNTRVEVRTATPVIVQTEVAVPSQPAPVVSNTTVISRSEPTPVYVAASNEPTSMPSERMPRADRN